MPLEINQIGFALFVATMEEVVKANIVEGRSRRERGDMAAKISGTLVGAHNHGHGIPADQGANTALHEEVAGHRRLLGHRNTVPEWRGNGIWQFGSVTARPFREPLKNVFGPVYAFVLDQRFQRVQPFTGFNGIIVLVHQTLPLASKSAAPPRSAAGRVAVSISCDEMQCFVVGMSA